MFLEYRESGFAVTEVAVVITEGETRGELSQVAFADRLTTQRAQTLSTGTSPVHQDEFHMRPPPEKLFAYNFALEANPNVVPSSRQSGIGRCRSNLEWRELGDWNRTSSTLVRRSRMVGLGGASVLLTLVTNSKLDERGALPKILVVKGAHCCYDDPAICTGREEKREIAL